MLYRLLFSALAMLADPAQAAAEPPPVSLRPAGPSPDGRAGGTPGTASAWDKDKTTLIESLSCARTDTGWDYDGCIRELRKRMLTRVCARRGAGRHLYYLQRGDGPRSRATVRCEE